MTYYHVTQHIRQAYKQPFLLAEDGESYIPIKTDLCDEAYLDAARRKSFARKSKYRAEW